MKELLDYTRQAWMLRCIVYTWRCSHRHSLFMLFNSVQEITLHSRIMDMLLYTPEGNKIDTK